MIYPKHTVDKYKELVLVEQALETAKGRNFYDKQPIVDKLQEEVDRLSWEVQEEASVFASESGADRDGGYDPDRLFDELEEQLNKGV